MSNDGMKPLADHARNNTQGRFGVRRSYVTFNDTDVLVNIELPASKL